MPCASPPLPRVAASDPAKAMVFIRVFGDVQELAEAV